MPHKTKQLLHLLTLSSSLLLLSGCVAKKSDGSYPSNYSYHPYNRDTKRYSPIKMNPQPRAITSYQQTPLKIEKVAKSMLGIRYKYGANGPDQYDCSSFTQYLFSRQGIKIPRVSRDQAKVGKLISKEHLQKGDLIFFDSKKSSRISHVGIYLSKGEFIHASSAKHQVTISRLDATYYQKHFKWGRRVIPYRYNYALESRKIGSSTIR